MNLQAIHDAESVVEEAKRQAEQAQKKLDEVWCVIRPYAHSQDLDQSLLCWLPWDHMYD